MPPCPDGLCAFSLVWSPQAEEGCQRSMTHWPCDQAPRGSWPPAQEVQRAFVPRDFVTSVPSMVRKQETLRGPGSDWLHMPKALRLQMIAAQIHPVRCSVAIRELRLCVSRGGGQVPRLSKAPSGQPEQFSWNGGVGAQASRQARSGAPGGRLTVGSSLWTKWAPGAEGG